NVAREVNRLHGWSGPLWSRRHRAIVVSDEEAKQVDLLAYHLAQGTKENLVWSPCDWPGVHTAWALVNGEPLRGIWVDRTAMYRARQRGERPRKADYTVRVDRKSTRLNSSHVKISYAVFCLKKKKVILDRHH